MSRDFARVVEATHSAGRETRRRSVPAATPGRRTPLLAWILCVIDDEPCADSLGHLAATKSPHARVLCLFTRYARVDDIVRARRHGFLFYRWDGTNDNARSIARSLLGPGWIGLLYPGERLAGDVDALNAFLDAQPETVTGVAVESGGAQRDTRFVRIGRGDTGGAQVSCPAVRISRGDDSSPEQAR